MVLGILAQVLFGNKLLLKAAEQVVYAATVLVMYSYTPSCMYRLLWLMSSPAGSPRCIVLGALGLEGRHL
jgi:hypothetical protein